MKKDEDKFRDLDEVRFGVIDPSNVFNSEVVKKIDEFVEHYYNGDYAIDRSAFSVPCLYNGQKGSLGNFLTGALTNYLIAKGNNEPSNLCNVASELIIWITQARGGGCIIENASLLSKLKNVEEQNKQLKETKDLLEVELSELRIENEELHKVLDNFGSRSTVEKP